MSDQATEKLTVEQIVDRNLGCLEFEALEISSLQNEAEAFVDKWRSSMGGQVDWDLDFFDGITTHRLSIEVDYGTGSGADVVLNSNGYVLRHRFDAPRESTEEERAAVGWTW